MTQLTGPCDYGRVLLLLDTPSLYFRAFYGIPETMTAPDGMPVNAVRGLIDMTATLVKKLGPDEIVACMDASWRPAFRVAAIPSYKAHRLLNAAKNIEITPPLLDAQLPMIVDALDLLGIARVGAAGFEADDVIGTLAAKEAAAAPGRADVDVVTGDRDLFQLVDDAATVRVLYVGRGVRNLEVVDEARLLAKYGVRGGDGYADLAVLRGDPSDGLPGVAGIGEKTAAGLLGRFGSLDDLLAAAADPASDISAGQRRKLAAAADYLAKAPAVVRVARDAPVSEHDDLLPQTPPDHQALIEFAQRWGVESSVTRVVQALG